MSRSKEKEDNNISVIIRIKPEDYSQKYAPIDVSNSNSISILSENKEYFFDYIGEEKSTQNEIFERCGKKICDYALEGYNGTIFAYGQTGSGKTYTLLGKNITNKLENKNINISALINNAREDIKMSELNNDISSYYDTKDENIGLLPRILYYLFQNKEKSEEDNKYIFKISYLELYKEKMIDLLFPGGDNNNIRISDSNKVLEIKNLRKFMIDSPEEAIKLIIDGNRFRHTAATLMNDESSRSHAIISIYIENTLINENKVKKSVFHIIDLAGSERQTKTGTFGERVKEAGEINKSLLNLSIVINQIINNAKQISYRDSKLTHLLKDSLGGNAKTSIIATISKLESNLRETINTLNFAQNAKKIKNKAIINEELSGKDAKFLLEKLDNLQKNYNSMVQQCTKLKKELQNQRNSINEKVIMPKSLEIQNEDMNKVMKDILKKEEELKRCREENEALKDKIEKNELAFKLKDNDIKIFTIKLNNLNDEKLKLTNANFELKDKIKNLEQENNKNNEMIKIMKEKHKKELLEIENNYKNLQNENTVNDSVLYELKQKLKQYEEKINKMNLELNKSKKKIEEKETNFKEINSFVIQKENEDKSLITNINVYKDEIKSKNKELDELTRNNIEIRTKEKEFINKYEAAIIKNNEEILKQKEEIKLLNENLFQKNKKIEKIVSVINEMEKENNLLKDKYNSAQKSINEYLETIALLHQKNLSLKEKTKEISLQKEQLEKQMIFMLEPFSNSSNKRTTINSNNNTNSKEFLQIKKEYENLKRNYDNLIKNLEPNKELNLSKVKKIQDLTDKLTLYSKEIEENKNVINNMIKKIGEKFNINTVSNYLKDKSDLKNKLESTILFVIDNINKKNEEIKSLNEEKEILLNTIKTNKLKKDLFEFLNAKSEINNEENNKKNLSDKIKKIREGYKTQTDKNKSQKRNMLLNNDLLSNKENTFAVVNDFNFPVDIHDYLENGINKIEKKTHHIYMKNFSDFNHNLAYLKGKNNYFNFYFAFLDEEKNYHLQIQCPNEKKLFFSQMAKCYFEKPITGVRAYNFFRELMAKNDLVDFKTKKNFHFGKGIHGEPMNNLITEIQDYMRNKNDDIYI